MMFTIAKSRICVTLILTIQSLFVLLSPANAATYTFSYIALGASGNAKVISINPLTHVTTTAQLQFFPQNTPVYIIYPQWVSPTGEWITFQYYPSPTTGGIRLVNLRSGETRDIAPTSIGLESPDYMRPDQVAAWSPNGRYLAFSMPTDKYGTKIDAYIYAINTKTTIKLNTHQGRSIRFSWSTDSSQLAVEGESYTASTIYGVTKNDTSIDILDIKSNSLTESIPDLGQAADYDLCSLNWSPDGRYIAYINGCDITDHSGAHEVMLWDTYLKKQFQVTSLATNMLSTSIGISTTYSIYWVSFQQLMVGMFVVGTAYPQSTFTTQTVIYDPSKGISTIYSNGQVQALSVNPISGKLAVSVVSGYNQDFTAISSQVRVGNLSSNVTTNGTILLDGSQFSWSPDGKFLAYQQASTNKFLFIDTSTNTPNLSYAFDDPSIAASLSSTDNSNVQGVTILPIGWTGAGVTDTLTPPASPVQPTPTGNGGSAPGGNQING